MDLFDVLTTVGESYLDSKKSKSDDPLEIFFSVFNNGKRKIDNLYDKDMGDFYRRRQGGKNEKTL